MIAIIDGDILAYNSCETRWDIPVSGEIIIELDEEGKRKKPVYTKEEDRRYLERAWDKFQLNLERLRDEVYCDQALVAVKGADNFRDLIYPDYKANRRKPGGPSNAFVPILRKLAVHEDLAVAADGREADDLIRIWAEQARVAGDDFIICSIDKDLDCIVGKHYKMPLYSWDGTIKRPGKFIEVSEIEAKRHFYEQLLKGDPTDNIPGLPGIGPKKAEKILQPFDTEEEFQEQVVGQYVAIFGEDEWYSQLLSNGKMLHLQVNPYDFFSVKEWAIVKELTQ